MLRTTVLLFNLVLDAVVAWYLAYAAAAFFQLRRQGEIVIYLSAFCAFGAVAIGAANFYFLWNYKHEFNWAYASAICCAFGAVVGYRKAYRPRN